MDFYNKYRAVCAEKGLSPTAAAAKAGISRTSVTRWKSGIAKPTPANLKKLCEVFNIPLSYWYDGEVNPTIEAGIKPCLFSCQNRVKTPILCVFRRFLQFIA